MARTMEPIPIDWIRDLQKVLKAMDGESQKKLREVFNKAADIIVDAARPRIPTRTGRARNSVKAKSGQREAKVAGGSAKAPYYPWLDFGGSVGRGHQPRKAGSGAIKRPFIQSGRYIYSEFEKNRDEVYTKLQEGLVELATEAGLEVTEGGG